MKKAIGYARKSTKDQSNFSIAGQQRYINEYCDQQEIELIEMFTDDGKSAKNFDRPNWHLLEAFIRNHHAKVDYLIVAKYDRFSRNVAQGLAKIELLEKKYQIIIVSVMEQMFIDYDSPFFFKQRADMLVSAEFEWHVIRDRTKQGNHNALMAGRFINKAPYGYLNGRDADNPRLPRLLINEKLAPIIRNIFIGFLQGLPFAVLRKNAREAGLKLHSHSSIPRILSNPVYGGLIFVPAYKKEPSKYVKGIHTGIIEEHEWWNVQRLLKKPSHRTILNDEVPLRALVQCECGTPFTAGKSKGKLKYYWYYKCNQHPNKNYSAILMHNKMNELLAALSLPQEYIEYMQVVAEEEMNVQLADRKKNLLQFRKELKEVEKSIFNLEEKFLSGLIQLATYERWYSKYTAEQSHLNYKIAGLNDNLESMWALFYQELPKLGDIRGLYENANIEQKRELLNQVFNSGIVWVNGVYRTPSLFSLFMPQAASLKEHGLLEIYANDEKTSKYVDCTRDGN